MTINRTRMFMALLGSAGALALAGCEGHADEPRRATVLDVTPVTELVQVPREVCDERVVERRQRERDGDIGGTVAGAVVGGLLGNQVGSGSGRKAATAAGAVAGGLAGREIDRRHEGGEVVAEAQQDCRTVYVDSEEVVAYRVEYEVDGEVRTTRMAEPPTSEHVLLEERLVSEDEYYDDEY